MMARPSGEHKVKPATFFFRSCGLAAVLLAGAVNSYAGLYYENPEDERFKGEEVKCKQELAKANVEYGNDKLRCQGNRSCLADAQRRFSDAEDQVTIHHNNNNGTHNKWMIDQRRAPQGKKVFNESSDADAVENLRHFNAETTIEKKGVDVETQYENDKVLCRADKTGKKCRDAEANHAKALIEITCDRNTENEKHLEYQIAHPPKPQVSWPTRK
jgi:hypothetical protein